jgi:hypothetical protein
VGEQDGGNPAGKTGSGADGAGGTTVVDVDGKKPDEVVSMTRERFSQEVAKIAAREKDQGGRKAITDLGTRLGVQSVEEIEQIVAAYRQQQDAQLSEAERARVEATKLLEQAKAAHADAQQSKLEARSTAALTRAGAIDPDLLVAALAKLGVTADSSDEDLTAAVEQLKTQRTSQFARPGAPASAADPGRSPAGSPHAGESGSVQSAAERAKANVERIQQRRRGGRAPAR